MINKRASNIEVKKINRNKIFRCVNNYEKISKPDIAMALKISMPTVLQNINELIDQGLVHEIGEFESTGGRKAAAIAAVRNNYYALGIDITQNHIGLVLTDLSGDVLKHSRVFKPFQNERTYFKEMANMALEFVEGDDILTKEFLGVGISIPGIVDTKRNKIVYSHALSISNMDCGLFSEFIPYSCTFINDANAAGVAEMYHVDQKYNAIYLSLSNSVGGAVIKERQSYLGDNMINDFLYLGDNLRAGEFGHLTLKPGGQTCYCGKEGCVDVYCSAKNLAKYTDGKLETFFEELEQGKYVDIWEEYLIHLAVVVNSLRMIFDCRVIVGGYVGSFIEPYILNLRDKASKLNTFEPDGSYIQPCRYRVEASALGAALQRVETFVCTI